MSVKNKTCLFCLKQRQILVDDSYTGKAIQKIYSITLPTDGCRICIECHFNISRIREFKNSIEAAADLDVDSCFVCKSESTVSEPGVDRVVDYLLKQCTTIDIGNTDTVRACATCLYLLEICIKYEKLARNYANCQRFCKQFATIRECNVALGKIDLDTLGDICENFESVGGRPNKKGKKRARGSWGGREENASKRSKKEDGSVLPVMLTKLTPTMTPARPGGKKSFSPDTNSGSGKKGKAKPNNKIFIKLPTPRKLHWKKLHANRMRYGPPHSPSIAIPVSPSVEDLNRIFKVELRPLSVRIEHVDLSNYMNRTISHDKTTRHPRKPKKEEFIGLDEEDVVELQQNNTSITSVGKRKSILVTERIESPNSAKKKVKFSDSPSIKYVEKVNFSDDDDENSEDEKDVDYEDKKSKKKGPKPQIGNGTPENGKPRRGRPRKVDKEKDSSSKSKDEDSPTENVSTTEKKDEEESEKESTGIEQNKSDEKNEDANVVSQEEEATEQATKKSKEEIVTENGNANREEQLESSETSQSIEAAIASLEAAADHDKTSPEDPSEAAPMDTTEEQTPMAVDETVPATTTTKEDLPAEIPDEEMKDTEPARSPDDVEMTESKSPPSEDVEMKETNNVTENHSEEPTETETEQEVDSSSEKKDIAPESMATEFETSDREDEIEQVKQCLNNILGEQTDSEPSQAGDQSNQEPVTSEEQQQQPEVEPEAGVETEVEPEVQAETDKTEAQSNTETEPEPKLESSEAEKASIVDTPEKKDQTFSSLDDVDDISDDDDILDQLDEVNDNGPKRSPDLPPLGEDSL